MYSNILRGGYAKLKGNIGEWRAGRERLCLHLGDGAQVSREPCHDIHTHGRRTWIMDMMPGFGGINWTNISDAYDSEAC